MNRKYTEEHKQFIRDNVTGRRFPELTEMFNTHFGTDYKEAAIKSLVYRIGLGNGIDARFNKGHEPTQFMKGHTPWNKGKPKSWVGGEETQFKKGNVPHNRRPIGSERIDSKDGYVHIKIQDGHLNRNWKPKHILIWEKENGPVPPGHAIVFGDRDKRNFDIDNLICVSRSQLVRLNQNGLIQKDAELTKIGIVVADVITKISERRKQN